MKSFITRVITALIAITAVVVLYYYTGSVGLKALGWLTVVLGGQELARILFPTAELNPLKIIFYVILVSLFALSFTWPKWSELFFSFSMISFVIVSLSFFKHFDIYKLTHINAKACLGFFYLGLLPGFGLQILEIKNGTAWFSAFLIVVFSGDIGAYLAGSLFGKDKIFPHISPKKSYQGALGGLMFALIAATFCQRFILHGTALGPWLVLAGFTTIIAQFGDFFESLLKRVAHIKDSGTVMPGHGGVLDRLDGVLFASPVMLFGIQCIHLLTISKY
ncbi:MAG: phosphatidate cytidylyltransferase [Pseudobdellovibrionaceae bacterium]